MNAQHASITALILQLDEEYKKANETYQTTKSREEQDKALRKIVSITATALDLNIQLPSMKKF